MFAIPQLSPTPCFREYPPEKKKKKRKKKKWKKKNKKKKKKTSFFEEEKSLDMGRGPVISNLGPHTRQKIILTNHLFIYFSFILFIYFNMVIN